MILKTRIFAVLGGDLRSVAAEKILSDFFTTRLYGFEKLGKNADSLVKTLENADFVLLPLPLSADGKTLNAPFSEKETFLSELLPAIPEKAVIFGANIPESFKDGKHIFIDLFARDDIQILNAVPTAEGAIAEAINETEKTLWRSKCLVVGFGRIGKALAFRLKALGADVTVSARKDKDFAEISAFGFTPARSDRLCAVIKDSDIVFNTVPIRLIGEKELLAAQKETLFIDLASKPGGIDFSVAERSGLKVLWLLSLPGKTAPKTAGEIIAETVLHILKGGETNGE